MPRLGANQDVFFFQFSEPDQFGLRSARFCFYDGINIYVAFIPDGVSPPQNLPALLIKGGIKTYFTLGDRSYEFN